MIDNAIKSLVNYGITHKLISKEDEIYATNRILEVLNLEDYKENATATYTHLEEILEHLLNFAYENKIIEQNTVTYRDLLDTKLMGCITPPPSMVVEKFFKLYKKSPKNATRFYYEFSMATDYIRKYRTKKDVRWKAKTKYGVLDITINLAKPEKDPKDIIAAGKAVASGYPKCLLCCENEGYSGRINYPARQNHRIIPIKLTKENWYLQYSPYVYYNEHCIVLNAEHTPMKIGLSTFTKLLDFVRQFPHYFVGSNADIPIVGGSILSHDHFQGGNYTFPMAKAKEDIFFKVKGFEDIKTTSIKWPMFALRLTSKNPRRIALLADYILEKWRTYTDEEAFIYSHTENTPHNTITPIARRVGDSYQLDLVLRNNITTKEHPMGVFHPHANLHHIKKENIGLIEVMGLAVLPSRLKSETDILAKALLKGDDVGSIEEIAHHKDWAEEFVLRHPQITEANVHNIINEEIGKAFLQVLEDAGVYKNTKEGKSASLRFIKSL